MEPKSSTSPAAVDVIVVGDRVEVDGCRATVRYLGPVDGYGEQQWAGLEWDDPSRGKHDGVVKGRRYFQTRSPAGGSLVKLGNVHPPLDLLSEIRHRYSEQEAEVEVHLDNSSKVIELVGMEKTATKQSNVHALVNIVLDGRNVGRPPPEDTPPFPVCRELNLHGNLLHRWTDVKGILSFFPNVDELVLRKNRMDEFDDEFDGEPFSTSVGKLVVSECNLNDKSVQPVLARFPSATEVVAFGNGLTRFVAGLAAQRIVVLDLEMNPVGKMSQIVGPFPCLRKLSVCECGIGALDDLDGSQFPSLDTLNLKLNPICQWQSVNQLQTLKSLTVLHIDCKQFSCENGIAVHEVMIAKLAGLVELNRFDVSEIERRSAEIRYLNKYYAIKDDANKAAHVADLQRLIKMHGEPSTDTVKKGLNVLKMNIVCGEKSIQRALPLTITVQRVSEMLIRVFGVDGDVRLYLQGDVAEHRVELDNPLRPFSHYSPDETDRLVVDPINAASS